MALSVFVRTLIRIGRLKSFPVAMNCLTFDLEVRTGNAAVEMVEVCSQTVCAGMSRSVRGAAGLSIIFGPAGFICGWNAQRRRALPVLTNIYH